MKLKIETYASIPCELKKFYINDKPVKLADFGSAKNTGFAVCNYTGFTARPKRDCVLKKYCISAAEYDEVVKQLDKKFGFGVCEYCVR